MPPDAQPDLCECGKPAVVLDMCRECWDVMARPVRQAHWRQYEDEFACLRWDEDHPDEDELARYERERAYGVRGLGV